MAFASEFSIKPAFEALLTAMSRSIVMFFVSLLGITDLCLGFVISLLISWVVLLN